jgi:hypothetical protein
MLGPAWREGWQHRLYAQREQGKGRHAAAHAPRLSCRQVWARTAPRLPVQSWLDAQLMAGDVGELGEYGALSTSGGSGSGGSSSSSEVTPHAPAPVAAPAVAHAPAPAAQAPAHSKAEALPASAPGGSDWEDLAGLVDSTAAMQQLEELRQRMLEPIRVRWSSCGARLLAKAA